MDELPIPRGMFLCEKLIVEERTRNVTLVNLLTQWVVDEVPTAPQQFVVFALLANGRGTMPVELRVTRLKDGEHVFSQVQPITFENPLAETRFASRMSRFRFAEAGLYEFSLEIGTEQVSQTRVEVRVRGTTND